MRIVLCAGSGQDAEDGEHLKEWAARKGSCWGACCGLRAQHAAEHALQLHWNLRSSMGYALDYMLHMEAYQTCTERKTLLNARHLRVHSSRARACPAAAAVVNRAPSCSAVQSIVFCSERF